MNQIALRQNQKSGRMIWIPWLIAGMFLPVILVNLLLVRYALSSSTGLVTDHAFDTGQSYNAVIAAGKRQAALGWHEKLAISPAPMAGQPHRVTVSLTLTSPSGIPVTGLLVSGRVTSPVVPLPDQPITLVEGANGAYSQSIDLPRPGAWDLQLIAGSGPAQFALDQRLTAP